jgi:AraC family transcriptional activator of pobA
LFWRKLIKNQKTLLSINEALKAYKQSFKKNPKFGMDVFLEGFEVSDVAILEKDATLQKNTPIRFDFFALLLCLDGELVRHVNQYEFHIPKYSLQLICPGSIYSFENVTQTTEIYILLFSEEFFKSDKHDYLTENVQSLLEYHKLNINPVVLSSNVFSRVKNIYEDIHSELHEKQTDYLLIVKLLILKLLFMLKRDKITQSKSDIPCKTRAEQIFHQYLDLIEEHFMNLKKVSEYAVFLDISSKHLGETIKEISAQNALFYIHNRILKEALYLLEYTNLTITQIASSLNFTNASVFSRFFKLHYKITPQNYRLNIKK